MDLYAGRYTGIHYSLPDGPGFCAIIDTTLNPLVTEPMPFKQEKISQEHRDYALRTALATVRLEGLEPSQDAKDLMTKVAKGEITSAEAIEAAKQGYAASA